MLAGLWSLVQPLHQQADDRFLTLARNADLLAALQAGFEDRDELADEIGVSGKTIYRRTRKLRELGVVERTPDGYALTDYGRLTARMITDAREVVGTFHDRSDLLTDLPEPYRPPYQLFAGGSTTFATTTSPTRPLDELRSFLKAVDECWGIAPAALAVCFETNDPVDGLQGGLQRLVIAEDAALPPSEHSPTSLTSELATSVWTTAEAVPLGVFFAANDEMALLLTSSRGEVSACVRRRSRLCAQWARSTYLRSFETATPITAASVTE